MSIGEKLEEITVGIRERLKSSFLVTFIAIWCIHHWRLIYMFLNMDEDMTLSMKLSRINRYITDETVVNLWWKPICWTFLSLILYYIFSLASELLNIGFENGRKAIYKAFDNKKLVLKTRLDELQRSFESVSARSRDLDEENTKLVEVRKEAERKQEGLTRELQGAQKDVENLQLLGIARDKTVEELTKAKEVLEREILAARTFAQFLEKEGFVFYKLESTEDFHRVFFRDKLIKDSSKSALPGEYEIRGTYLVNKENEREYLTLENIQFLGNNQFEAQASFAQEATTIVDHFAKIKYEPEGLKFRLAMSGKVFEITPPKDKAIDVHFRKK